MNIGIGGLIALMILPFPILPKQFVIWGIIVGAITEKLDLQTPEQDKIEKQSTRNDPNKERKDRQNLAKATPDLRCDKIKPHKGGDGKVAMRHVSLTCAPSRSR